MTTIDKKEMMYLSCLLIVHIISISVRPAESAEHDVGSVVSKLKRSSLNSARGFHLSAVGLAERLYWFPRPLKRERSKPPNAAGARFIPAMRVVKGVTGIDPELKRPREGRASRASKVASMTKRVSVHTLEPWKTSRFRDQSTTVKRLCYECQTLSNPLFSLCRPVNAYPSVLVGIACLCVSSAHETLCHQRLPDRFDRRTEQWRRTRWLTPR